MKKEYEIRTKKGYLLDAIVAENVNDAEQLANYIFSIKGIKITLKDEDK